MATTVMRSLLKKGQVPLQVRHMCYSSSVPTTKLFIDGKFVESKTSEWLDIHNPATNEVIARVPKATQEEMLAAVDSCSQSYHSWSETSILARQQIFLRYQQLIKDNIKELARSITLEQGKTLADAEGDVFRGLQVVEHTCSITSLMLGETLPSITKDMDTYTYRLPIGVCAGIAPFNFPAMIPLWMFPMGMVCGNTYLLKPSERVPACTMLLAKMLQDAGMPDGTLNIIHGQHDAVNFICDHPAIKAISFVGSNQAGEYIYERGSKNGKRVQSNMGAKNHGVVMPDANKETTLNQLVGAASGQNLDTLPQALFIVKVILSVATISFTIFLLISAFRNEKPMFLVPWLVYTLVCTIIGIGVVLYFGVVLALAGVMYMAIIYFVGLLAFALMIYFWIVVFSYMHELKDNKRRDEISKA